jgi:hypothetical protein
MEEEEEYYMLFNIRKVMVNNNGNNESFGQKINGAFLSELHTLIALSSGHYDIPHHIIGAT